MNDSSVTLRDVEDGDLPVFFSQQLDPEANYMAAFTHEDPTDHDAFVAHWAKIRSNNNVRNRTILFDGNVAGHVANFEMFGESQVSYWLGKEYWGKGIATKALALFLSELTERPLYGRAAKDNAASIRVLEKCGFKILGYDTGFANARGKEIEEVILRLDAA